MPSLNWCYSQFNANSSNIYIQLLKIEKEEGEEVKEKRRRPAPCRAAAGSLVAARMCVGSYRFHSGYCCYSSGSLYGLRVRHMTVPRWPWPIRSARSPRRPGPPCTHGTCALPPTQLLACGATAKQLL